MNEKPSYEELERELESLREENQRLASMLTATKAIPLAKSFNESARLIYDICKSLVGGTCGYVALKNENNQLNELLFLDDGGLPCSVNPELPMPIQGLRAEAYQLGEAVYENDFMSSEWLKLMPPGHVRLNNVMFAPLNVGDKTLGILGIANKPTDFTPKDKQIAESFGDIAALALEHGTIIEELIQNRTRFDLAVNATRDGIWDWNIETNEEFFAPRWCEIIGYSPNDPELPHAYDSWASRIHPDDKARVMEAVRAHLEEGTVYDVRYRHKHKSGQYCWQQSRGKAVFDESGKPVRMVGSISDIHEEHSALEKIKENEAKFRLAFQTSPDSINLNRLEDGMYLEINHGFTEILGYTPQEVLGKTSLELNIWKSPADREKLVQGLRQDGYVENLEARFVAKDGSIRYGLMSARVLTINNERVIISITRDITERKNAEKELNFHSQLLDQIQDHITATDLNGNIVYVNQAVCKSLKRSRTELVGNAVSIYGEDPEKGASQEQIVKTTLAKGEWRGEIVNYSKDGNPIIMDCRTKRIENEFGDPVSLIGIATDITENQRIAERLQQAQKMESIGNLAGGIAHDFNNILFPVVGMAEMLVEDLPLDSHEQEYANEILQAGRRGAELVKQILAFGRQHEHVMAPVRLQFVMKEVLKLTRSTIPVNFEMSQYLQSDCGLVLADSTQLHQIGMNLITNAYHAIQDKGGKIHVEVREVEINKGVHDLNLPPGRYANLTVSDTGVGIKNEYLSKIFEPYFTTKGKGKGTGLGLSVVYGIVTEHKGEITVMSEPGKGTSFQIYLPVMVDSSPVDDGSGGSFRLPTGTEHILLVDDERPIVKLEKQILERLGYNVTEKVGSLDALDVFRKNPNDYDLVITDMSMPKMTGKDLAEELMKIRPDIPIIVCTGFSERFDENAAKAMGIRGFLMKPLVRMALAKEVRKVLDSAL